MVNIIADLHTHTIASGHAADTIRTICEFALKKGLKGIAIADHGPGVSGGANIIYFWALHRLTSGVKSPLRLITGVEDDIKNKQGDLTLPQEVLSKMEIVQTGLHPYTWIAEQSVKVRTDAVINAIVKGYIQVLTHPVGAFYEIDIDAVIDAAKSSHVALELNTSKMNERKPIVSFLEKCVENEVSIVVNSDAHVAEEVGDFNDALTLLEKLNFPEKLIINRSQESITSFFKFIW